MSCKEANILRLNLILDGFEKKKVQRDGEIPAWIIFTMIHRSCPMATRNNSSQGYLAHHLLTHKQVGNERFYHSFSLLCARTPHHQLGEK